MVGNRIFSKTIIMCNQNLYNNKNRIYLNYFTKKTAFIFSIVFSESDDNDHDVIIVASVLSSICNWVWWGGGVCVCWLYKHIFLL